MNILHVIRGLANSSGTTHIVGPLAEAQARLGHRVKVMFVQKPNEMDVVPNPQLVESRSFPMTVRSRHYGWSRPFARTLKYEFPNADVIHVHAIWNYPTWRAMKEANRYRVPYFVAPQGSLEPWALSRTRRLKRIYAHLFEKRLFDDAAAMQALTQAEVDQCKRFGIRAPVRILPNGVDARAIQTCSKRANLRQELGLPEDSFLLLFLGRLFPKKGLDLLLPAFETISKERAEAHLVVAGHDAGTGYRETLDEMIRMLGLSDRVHFIGEVRGERKFEVLRDADVFVLTSYSEGLPVAVLEAMACELPVIVTPGCNLPEVAEHCAGWVVRAEIQSIRAGLLEAVNDIDECRRRGRNGSRLIEDRFTWDAIAEKSLEIYESFQR